MFRLLPDPGAFDEAAAALLCSSSIELETPMVSTPYIIAVFPATLVQPSTLTPWRLKILTLCSLFLTFFKRVLIVAVDLLAAAAVPAPSIFPAVAGFTFRFWQLSIIPLVIVGVEPMTID